MMKSKISKAGKIKNHAKIMTDNEKWEKEHKYRKLNVDGFNCRKCKHLIVELGNREKGCRCNIRRDERWLNDKKVDSFIDRYCTCDMWEKWEKEE